MMATPTTGRWPALAYAAASVLLVATYPVLPTTGRDIVLPLVLAGAVPCVIAGRHRVPPHRRLPWTLLLAALTVIIAAGFVPRSPAGALATAGWTLDAAGNALACSAALALILRQGLRDLGGVIDTALAAFAAGGLLWGLVLPHRVGADTSPGAQLDLFVAVFALTGVLGALLRLARRLHGHSTALWWLMIALGLGIGANAVLAFADTVVTRHILAEVLFMSSFVALGLFGLDPSGPGLAGPVDGDGIERLTIGRLVFLGFTVAVVPLVNGLRDVFGRGVDGELVAVQGVVVATLVMVRIGLLSAQRARAERALSHEATHDQLTQLVNRRELMARLADELAHGRACVLLFCDLDSFKLVNDRFGHGAGDQLLVDVADRLRRVVPARHPVSRFGGDEFVILLVDPGPTLTREVAAGITAAMASPFAPAGGSAVGLSVGVAQAGPATGIDPDELVRRADRAMYQAKARHYSEPGYYS